MDNESLSLSGHTVENYSGRRKRLPFRKTACSVGGVAFCLVIIFTCFGFSIEHAPKVSMIKSNISVPEETRKVPLATDIPSIIQLRSHTLRILNLNVEHFNYHWKERLQKMAELILQTKPHIITIQRARIYKEGTLLDDQLKELQHMLPRKYAYVKFLATMTYTFHHQQEGIGVISALPFLGKPQHKTLSYLRSDDDENRRAVLHVRVNVSRLVPPESRNKVDEDGVSLFIASSSYSNIVNERHMVEVWEYTQSRVKSEPYILIGNLNIQGPGDDNPFWLYLTGQKHLHHPNATRGTWEPTWACLQDAWAELHPIWGAEAMTYSSWFPTSRPDMALYGHPPLLPHSSQQSSDTPVSLSSSLSSSSSSSLAPLQLVPLEARTFMNRSRVHEELEDAPACHLQSADAESAKHGGRFQMSDHLPLLFTFGLKPRLAGPSSSPPSTWKDQMQQCQERNKEMWRQQLSLRPKTGDGTSDTDQTKYLIVASAPMALPWWQKYKEYFRSPEWRVIGVNNAWLVVFPHLTEWFHASDFSDAGSLFPSEPQWPCIKSRTVTQCLSEMYKQRKTCIALIDALYIILKRHSVDGPNGPTAANLTVVVVGADMVYSSTGTHFYMGDGAKDPLREGRPWLESELKHLHQTFSQRKVKLFNAGPERPSLLPFPWFEDHLSLDNRS